MNITELYQRLESAALDFEFYQQVGDWGLAEDSRQRWVYLNSLIEGERRAA